MKKEVIATSKAPKAVGPYSQAVKVGDMLYCSGQISINPDNNELELGSVQEQTHRVMKNIEAVLSEASGGFEHIIKTSIFLKDMNDFASVNEVYASYLKEPYPARSTVAVAGLPKGVSVEIEVIARI